MKAKNGIVVHFYLSALNEKNEIFKEHVVLDASKKGKKKERNHRSFIHINHINMKIFYNNFTCLEGVMSVFTPKANKGFTLLKNFSMASLFPSIHA